MSVSAGLNITFDRPVNIIKLIDDLLTIGWTYNDNGRISYLPIGDSDDFDWKFEKLENWNLVKNFIDKKISQGELVGLSMVWGNTGIGGDLLAGPGENFISFSLSINRKRMKGKLETDVDWYLDVLQKPLTNAGYNITNIDFSEFD